MKYNEHTVEDLEQMLKELVIDQEQGMIDLIKDQTGKEIKEDDDVDLELLAVDVIENMDRDALIDNIELYSVI